MQYFSRDQITSLAKLSPGAKIHVIGVCGVAMAQSAIALSERGFVVSGSDKEFYEPMGSLLKQSKIFLFTGYAAEHVAADLDLVVIGNAVSRNNPEVEAVERLKLRYSCFPQILQEVVIAGKHSIVVSGTHGKSTTTAMFAATLERLQARPSYFIGGVARDLPQSLHAGEGKESVVEGDEYDSAFFAKIPKFHFYQPDSLVVTSVEYDHADIYPSLAAIDAEFLAVAKATKEKVFVCIDDPRLQTLFAPLGEKVVTYGSVPHAAWQIVEQAEEDTKQTFTFLHQGREYEGALSVPGKYNALNALAVVAVLSARGYPIPMILAALSQFQGVKRRQEVIGEGKGVILIEDFAHHPTAVAVTLEGIARRYPAKRIVAAFEPRSNSSRRKVFESSYGEAFLPAHRVLLSNVPQREADRGLELMDVSAVAELITRHGKKASCHVSVDHLFATLEGELQSGDVVVVMSNGSFSGLLNRIQTFLGIR